MVDCRPAAGAAPHELAHAAPNGAPPPPENNHHNQINQVGSGDMQGSHVPSPAARASTPAAPQPMPAYGPGMQMGNAGGALGGVSPALGYAPAYYGGGKALGGVVWVPPPLPPPLPPPPHHVNPHVFKSVQPNGSDLPMNDIPTLRYYFNLGVDWMWATYGPPPPRPYTHRDISQDMQAMSLNERSGAPMEHNKHKPVHAGTDKPPMQGKGNGQRSLLGPRFNKRGNQDGNQNQNHNQNKGHNNNNNNMANKGPNNRRNSHESRVGPAPPPYEAECVDSGLVPVPYIPYPPPVYPVQYYPIDSNEPGMMGMMGGMGYVNYEEGGEFVHTYYPPPPPPTCYPPLHLHHPAPEHK